MRFDRSMHRPAKGFKSHSRKRMIQIVLVFLISFSILLLSAYLDYCDLREADFLSRDISFENPDQDNLLTDQHNESKVLISSAFPIGFPPGIDFLEPFSLFNFPTYSPDSKTFVLRC